MGVGGCRCLVPSGVLSRKSFERISQVMGRSVKRQTPDVMLNRLAPIAALSLVACGSLPESQSPVFYFCKSNVVAVRTQSIDSPGASKIEVQLRTHARREFELLAKRYFGQSIRLASGETVLGQVKVLFGFRTGRVSFAAESLSAREAFDRLNPPADSPCGSAV
jgi:hypothetical protein